MTDGPALSPAQQRTLAQLRRGDTPVVFDAAFVDDLVGRATTAIADISRRLAGEPLWISKGRLAKVHGCEVAYLAPDDFRWRPSTAAGFVAHKAIELLHNWRGTPLPEVVVDEAIARLADEPSDRGTFIAGLSDGDYAELRSRAVERTTAWVTDFPPLPASAYPVFESPMKWRPPGTVEFGGKADLVLGRSQGDESREVVIDVKSGGKSPVHRADLRFYALIQTLRRRIPPRRLVSYYLDYSECDVEDVTEGLLDTALERTLQGIERHVELHVEGRQPVKRVGVPCRWCPVADDCVEGQAYLTGGDPATDGGTL